MKQLAKIGLGGGCHWCTEGIFVSLIGVSRVEQGWISSDAPDAAFSEAVIVHYQPEVITPEQLIEVHLETHAATSDHAMRGKYRSAVYAFTSGELLVFQQLLEKLAAGYSQPLLTRVLPFRAFKPSLPEHQDYYRSDPERPFCRRYITPKLEQLRERKSELLRSSPDQPGIDN